MVSAKFNRKHFCVFRVCFVLLFYCQFGSSSSEVPEWVGCGEVVWGGGVGWDGVGLSPVRVVPRPDKAIAGTAVLSHAHVERQRSSTTGCDVRRQGCVCVGGGGAVGGRGVW